MITTSFKHVLNRAAGGVKPQLVADLGATYHAGESLDGIEAGGIVLECTGVPSLVVPPCGRRALIVCLTEVTSSGRSIPIDVDPAGGVPEAVKRPPNDVKTVLTFL